MTLRILLFLLPPQLAQLLREFAESAGYDQQVSDMDRPRRDVSDDQISWHLCGSLRSIQSVHLLASSLELIAPPDDQHAVSGEGGEIPQQSVQHLRIQSGVLAATDHRAGMLRPPPTD